MDYEYTRPLDKFLDNKIRIKGKVIGEIRDNVYITTRRPEHYFIKYKGFGISSHIIQRLLKMKVREVRIIYMGERGRTVYITPLMNFLIKGNIHYNGTDKQYVLSVIDMEIE